MSERRRRAQARKAAAARRQARREARDAGLPAATATPTPRVAAAKRKPKRRTDAVARHPASNTPPGKKPPSPKVRRRRIVMSTIALGLAAIALMFAFVYPTSTFFQQRSQIGAAEQRLSRIDDEAKRLEKENTQLQGDAEVERIAREQYGLVRPGETPYVLVPAATPTTTPDTTSAPSTTTAKSSK
jgi:cell division protein FtsB